MICGFSRTIAITSSVSSSGLREIARLALVGPSASGEVQLERCIRTAASLKESDARWAERLSCLQAPRVGTLSSASESQNGPYRRWGSGKVSKVYFLGRNLMPRYATIIGRLPPERWSPAVSHSRPSVPPSARPQLQPCNPSLRVIETTPGAINTHPSYALPPTDPSHGWREGNTRMFASAAHRRAVF